ncbi:NnrU family protein [Agrobacterium vitis]|nr:NnrU family protein [Agrobacterium vitis]
MCALWDGYMANLVLALIFFVLTHSVPALPSIKGRLVSRLGRGTYMVLYSILSLVGLLWIFYAFMEADDVALWMDRAWQAWLTLVLVPIGLYLVVCGLISPNPYSVTFRAGRKPGAIVSITRHPVLWGFFLWAFGHIFPNGEMRGVILFGGFLLFSLVGMAVLDRRSRTTIDAAGPELVAATSVLPFAAVLSGRARLRLDREMAIALVLTATGTFALLFAFHEVLFGVDPLLLALYGV